MNNSSLTRGKDVILSMTDIGVKETVLAIITVNKDAVGGGGVPLFYAQDEEEQRRISIYLSRIVNGMIHDLGNGVKIIVKH